MAVKTKLECPYKDKCKDVDGYLCGSCMNNERRSYYRPEQYPPPHLYWPYRLPDYLKPHYPWGTTTWGTTGSYPTPTWGYDAVGNSTEVGTSYYKSARETV